MEFCHMKLFPGARHSIQHIGTVYWYTQLMYCLLDIDAVYSVLYTAR